MFYKNDAQLSTEVQKHHVVVIIVLAYLHIQQLREKRFLNLKSPDAMS